MERLEVLVPHGSFLFEGVRSLEGCLPSTPACTPQAAALYKSGNLCCGASTRTVRCESGKQAAGRSIYIYIDSCIYIYDIYIYIYTIYHAGSYGDVR